MTAAAQKEIFKQALALPRKARLDLLQKLQASLGAAPNRQAKSVTEPSAKYGQTKDGETLTQQEWDEAWGAELNKRIEELESGKVKSTRSLAYSEVRKKLDRILRKFLECRRIPSRGFNRARRGDQLLRYERFPGSGMRFRCQGCGRNRGYQQTSFALSTLGEERRRENIWYLNFLISSFSSGAARSSSNPRGGPHQPPPGLLEVAHRGRVDLDSTRWRAKARRAVPATRASRSMAAQCRVVWT